MDEDDETWSISRKTSPMSPEKKRIRLCADSVSIPTRHPSFSKWHRKQLKMRKFRLRRQVNITESLPMDRAMDLKLTISNLPVRLPNSVSSFQLSLRNENIRIYIGRRELDGRLKFFRDDGIVGTVLVV